jgi:hypothetical protein
MVETVAFRETPGAWVCARLDGVGGGADMLEVIGLLVDGGLVTLDVRRDRDGVVRGMQIQVSWESRVVGVGDWLCARFDEAGFMVLSDETYREVLR